MSNPTDRYKKLAINEALPRVFRYPIACKELSFILRIAYINVPKNLQTLILEDTLAAFRLLPQMKTESAVAAAHLLLQSAEATLPKQKRNLAVTEFKQAKIALKRRCKAQRENGDPSQLPQDVLTHVFSFLDLQSLVSAGQVCWSWCLAANDNRLWKMQCFTVFGDDLYDTRHGDRPVKGSSYQHANTTTQADWRMIFKRTYVGNHSKKFTANRGYCGQCKIVVWLHNMKCSIGNCGQESRTHKIKPVSPQQVVDYLLYDSDFMSIASSDSDSESDDGSISRLWAYPRNMGKRSEPLV